MSKVLVTGIAGFIGFHVAKKLLEKNYSVIGIDSLDNYYDVNLKQSRLNRLEEFSHSFPKQELEIYKGNIANLDFVQSVFDSHRIENVINLAAQAGVRYSLENPQKYVESNIVGFTNILECSKSKKIKHLVFASTSSVYGASNQVPFKESDPVSHPLQFYAATKRSNELMAHSYSNLYDLPTSGLRFFTVYGPWGRPDMALFIFTKNILEGKSIDVFNHGNHFRDFTYIDDIVSGINLVLENPPVKNDKWDYLLDGPGKSYAPHKIYNIGNGSHLSLNKYIELIEKHLEKKSKKNLLPLQPGDVPETLSDITAIKEIGYKPKVSADEGVKNFIDWYRDYYL